MLWTAKLFGSIDEVDADDDYFDVSRSPEEKAAAIEHLAEEIRRSELRKPLMIFCGGGVQVPYVRSFIKNMPPEETAGFHMGSDGYVWARNFSVKDPQQRGQLEIDRHWYNFMLWVRLCLHHCK